ncbi:unnamed protein product, partial [Didymodactylos carnosus]
KMEVSNDNVSRRGNFYVDEFCLRVNGIIMMFVGWITLAHSITCAASYQVIAAIRGGTFSLLMPYVKKHELGKIFLQDGVIFHGVNMKYFQEQYKELIFLITNVNNFTVKHDDELGRLSKATLDMNLFISVLPLVFNLPWTSNVILIIGAIFTRLTINESSVTIAIDSFRISESMEVTPCDTINVIVDSTTTTTNDCE